MKILYGTSNKGKVEAMKKIIEAHNFDTELYTLKDIDFIDEIEETGTTFEENSKIKAKSIKKFCDEKSITDKIIIADDAGLCVEKLNGEPGVYTGRYAGEHPTQMENITKLLNNMKDFDSEEDRKAIFICVLTAILPDGKEIIVRGESEGRISKKIGTLGKLTYGPIFIPKGFDKPLNDMEEKEYALVHNHRDIAMKELVSEFKRLGY